MMKYAAVALLILLALTSPVFAEENSQQVSIDGYLFKPASLTVTVGTKVTWTNRDQDPHTVVSTAPLFRSSALDTNESFSFVFTQPGNYPYFCSMHPTMTGTVIVQPAK